MKKLTIIIPVFNEEKTILKLIKKVVLAKTPGLEKEIIIIDDGSTDKTKKILKELKEENNFIFLSHPQNMGKGAAIKTGLKKSSGDFILTQDADLEYDPNDFPFLLKALRISPVVYGSRNLGLAKRGYFFYFLGGKLITLFFNLLFSSSLADLTTGYKLFRADIIKKANLQSNGFQFCEEITAKVLKLGYQIKEVPIHYFPRKFSEGKKIRFWDGIIAILTIIKYRFSN